MTEDAMGGWHHRLDGHEFEQAAEVGDGQRSLACCSPWGHKELDTSERLNWSELWCPQQNLHSCFTYFSSPHFTNSKEKYSSISWRQGNLFSKNSLPSLVLHSYESYSKVWPSQTSACPLVNWMSKHPSCPLCEDNSEKGSKPAWKRNVL